MAEKLPHHAFEQTVKVNLLGVWYCCQAAGRRMLEDGRGGSIINPDYSRNLKNKKPQSAY
jgi:NAD(P)-dependent dehydrogenase (short-subunit alcohol dehydrogenase family)